MKLKSLAICSLFLLSTSLAMSATSLESVIKADPEAAAQTSSELISPASGKLIKLADGQYQIRLFYFEDTKGKLGKVSFQDFASQNNLLQSQSQAGPDLDIEYFVQPQEWKDQGVYYFLSFRKLSNEEATKWFNPLSW